MEESTTLSRLTELLRQARKANLQLGADLEAEFVALTKCCSFSLVFEQHQPEAVGLPCFQGWYRNPVRAAKESLAAACKDEVDDWEALRPDFIFFGTNNDGSVAVDLVDSHRYHLTDALPKLRGPAYFAERLANDFHRVESVVETGDVLRVLDITKPRVRETIRLAQSTKTLYESEVC